MDKENKKFKLLLGMIIAIIAILLIGIVYQFVCIKKLEHKIDNLENKTAISLMYSENNVL